jgi:hypothetical protein
LQTRRTSIVTAFSCSKIKHVTAWLQSPIPHLNSVLHESRTSALHIYTKISEMQGRQAFAQRSPCVTFNVFRYGQSGRAVIFGVQRALVPGSTNYAKQECAPVVEFVRVGRSISAECLWLAGSERDVKLLVPRTCYCGAGL